MHSYFVSSLITCPGLTNEIPCCDDAPIITHSIMGFTIPPVADSLVYQAAEFKAEYSISFAGCFALASALAHKAAVVTGDPEFRKVEHLVGIVWIE